MKTKMKIILLALLALILFSGSVLATWLLQIEDGQTTTVTSIEGGTITFSTNLQDLALETTNGADSGVSTAVINNSNGMLEMVVLISEGRNDNTSDNCTDYINDVTAVYEVGGVQVFSGNVTNVSSGLSELNITVSALSHSCPQTFNTNITLTEV